MLNRLIFIVTGVIFSFQALAIPHLDLEATSAELEKFLQTQVQETTSPRILLHDQVIAMGRRNLDWLNSINQHRDEPIALYKPGELRGIPIEEPMSYGPSTIRNDHRGLQEGLPPEMKAVLNGETPVSKELPFEDVELYRNWAKKVDRLYQTTLRWEMLKNWRWSLTQRRNRDIRGYHFLSKMDDPETYVQSYASQAESEKQKIHKYLSTLCYNSANSSSGFENCRNSARQSLERNQGWAYANRYWDRSKRVYQSFFKIPARVRNRSTRKENGTLRSSFSATSDRYRDFLKANIEDEFNTNDFAFSADFLSSGGGVFVEWIPETTAHVKGLGSNHIVMDSNSSLDDWDTQWTIRHEFGHVLGLPDCYIEFFEPEMGHITNYQIDVNDLMCSRRGVMNQRIVNELKSKYF